MNKLIVLFIVLGYILPFHSNANNIENGDIFFKGSYHQAISEAQTQGKLLLLEFYADWCIPCQWMKKTTFKDPNLVDYLGEKTITMDVNIDDFAGFELKETYGVRFLPTIIVLNTEGDILIKHETSISASKLINILEDLNVDKNTKKIGTSVNSTSIADKDSNITSDPDVIISKSTNNENFKENTDTPEESASDAREDKNKSKIKVSSFSLQLGAFQTYENASKIRDAVADLINNNIKIILDDGIYKVQCTSFKTKESAIEAKEMIHSQRNIQSFILVE